MKSVRLFLSPQSRALSPISKEKITRNHLDFLDSSPTKPSSKIIELNTPKKLEIIEKGVTQNATVLGKGNFGTVFKGIQKDAPVAVKVVQLNKNIQTMNESNVRNLKHENVVEILDVFCRKGKNFGLVIMECLEATRLSQILIEAQNKLAKDVLVRYSADVARGLQFCHDSGILHLDIKPSNIVVTNDDVCKICDFGNSFLEGEKTFHNQGSPAYTAPEIFLGKLPTKKSDVYSFGITMWEMESRKQPYEEIENTQILIYKVVKFNLRPEKLENSSLHHIFEACWSSIAEDRPTLAQVQQQLLWL